MFEMIINIFTIYYDIVHVKNSDSSRDVFESNVQDLAQRSGGRGQPEGCFLKIVSLPVNTKSCFMLMFFVDRYGIESLGKI